MQAESFTHDESASDCARIDEYNGLFSVALDAVRGAAGAVEESQDVGGMGCELGFGVFLLATGRSSIGWKSTSV